MKRDHMAVWNGTIAKVQDARTPVAAGLDLTRDDLHQVSSAHHRSHRVAMTAADRSPSSGA